MPSFISPTQYSGTAELTASNGLEIANQAKWTFSQSGYNDGATFGVSLGWPNKGQGEYSYGVPAEKIKPNSSGVLHVRAKNWPIAVVGNTLTAYYDPDTGQTYSAERCRITVTGGWNVVRAVNSNSWNSIGVFYDGFTETNLGGREMKPYLLSYATPYSSVYVIQGSEVTGGAVDTFSDVEFFCRCIHSTTSNNSNREYQSNSVARPVFVYSYSKSWQID